MTALKIKGSKAKTLAALYNASRPQGMGFLHATAEDMTEAEAQAILDDGDQRRPAYFDYLKGRVMKVDLSADEFEPGLYDRDNGQGAAARAIEGIEETGA